MITLEARKQTIRDAVEAGDLDELIDLLDNETKTWWKTTEERQEAFDHAIVSDQAVIFEYFLSKGVIVSAHNVDNMSWHLCKMLVESGWDINTVLDDGCTLLWHWLCDPDDDEKASWLLENGADPNIGNRAESRHLNSNIPAVWKPDMIEMAAYWCRTSTLDLIIAHGAKLENSIPLHNMILAQYPLQYLLEPDDTVENLQSIGYDINGIHEFDNPYPSVTPLEIAIGFGNIEMVRMLLEHGANPAVNGPDSEWARLAHPYNAALIEMLEVFERSCQQDPEAMRVLFGTELLPDQPQPVASSENDESSTRGDGGSTSDHGD